VDARRQGKWALASPGNRQQEAQLPQRNSASAAHTSI